MMKDIMLNHYTRLFGALTLELKLELLAKLTESIQKEVKQPAPSALDKKERLKKVFGAWKHT